MMFLYEVTEMAYNIIIKVTKSVYKIMKAIILKKVKNDKYLKA